MPKGKVVILDTYGIVADTALYRLKVWHEVFWERGVEFTEDGYRRTFRQRTDPAINHNFRLRPLDMKWVPLSTKKKKASAIE